MQMPNIRETSYINDLLPHVVWMSLLNDELGVHRGIQASFELAKLTHSIHMSEQHVNFAVCGNYNRLSAEEKVALVETLKQRGSLDLYQQALSPLLQLHPACPMRFLGFAQQTEAALIDRLRRAVEIVFDRYGTPAAIMHANLIMIRASTGGLFIAEHIDIPDFDALVRDPDSEAAKRAASFARSGAMQELMADEQKFQLTWSKAFWNRNYRLDSCLLPGIPDE